MSRAVVPAASMLNFSRPVLELEAAARYPRVGAAPDLEFDALRDGHARLVDPAGARIDPAGENQPASFRQVSGESALHEKRIGFSLCSRRSDPGRGGCPRPKRRPHRRSWPASSRVDGPSGAPRQGRGRRPESDRAGEPRVLRPVPGGLAGSRRGSGRLRRAGSWGWRVAAAAVRRRCAKPGAGRGGQERRGHASSMGSVAMLPSAPSEIFSTRCCAAFSLASQWAFRRAPRS